MMPLNNASAAFEQRYASHLKHLKLQGLQTKTVDAYARAIRTLGAPQQKLLASGNGHHPAVRVGQTSGRCFPSRRPARNPGSSNKRIRSRLCAIYPYSLEGYCGSLEEW